MRNAANRFAAARETFFVQAIQGDRFEDFYIDAESIEEAIADARRQTTLDPRWVTFAF
jgi:hypothetical protein